jgi:hypothetical protein
LKEHALALCGNQLSPQRIEQGFANFGFGFVHKIPREPKGKKRRTSYHIASFMLCKSYPTGNVDIKLICSESKEKDAKMVKVAEEYVRQQGGPSLFVISLPEKKSMDWYKSQGFEINSALRNMKTYKLKGYFMMKKL